ncbi:MAG: hypothetical protein BWY15_02438 [Firmicutes bacterium ADurb.Bin193]|nr:MAG: hypothetical protein BWY15_02438 [Firmicutes bacterium ADurb.Bin193]
MGLYGSPEFHPNNQGTQHQKTNKTPLAFIIVFCAFTALGVLSAPFKEGFSSVTTHLFATFFVYSITALLMCIILKLMKKPVKKGFYSALVIMVVSFVALGFSGVSPNESTPSTPTGNNIASALSKEEFVESCQAFEYIDISRNPNQYKGKMLCSKARLPK